MSQNFLLLGPIEPKLTGFSDHPFIQCWFLWPMSQPSPHPSPGPQVARPREMVALAALEPQANGLAGQFMVSG